MRGSETDAAGSAAARQEDAAEKQSALRSRLSHARHELCTPLNAIIGYAEMLLDDAEDAAFDEEQVADLRRIQAAGKQLLALVNDLMDAGRFEARSAPDLEELAIEVRHSIRNPLNHVIGYCELLLDQPSAGSTELAPSLGKILSAAKILLAHSDRIVELIGGESFDGAGAAPPPPPLSPGEIVPDLPVLEGADHSGLILVVDDNETNRELLTLRLQRQGSQVVTAANGRAALDLLRSHPFDLVLLDIMMPEVNGYEVLQHMKTDPDLRHLPVIMISALDDTESVVRCIEIGADDFLSKPFDPVLLRARIGACLEKKRLRDREVEYRQQIEREKQLYDQLLHVLLPSKIVEEYKRTGAVQSRWHDNVAVLFCDIVGFTPYCEQREPEEVIGYFHDLVQAWEELALRYDLEKIKTIGDSFMATCGLLRPVKNPVLNCVRCAREMIETARTMPPKWSVRVGIHVGPVMAGAAGKVRWVFDVWGDTVNTAARVESHGVDGMINLTSQAWQCVAEHCRGESLGEVPVKGKRCLEIVRVDDVTV